MENTAFNYMDVNRMFEAITGSAPHKKDRICIECGRMMKVTREDTICTQKYRYPDTPPIFETVREHLECPWCGATKSIDLDY
jgi:ribosomal protein S14